MFYLSIGREFGFAILSFADMQIVPFARGALSAPCALRRCGGAVSGRRSGRCRAGIAALKKEVRRRCAEVPGRKASQLKYNEKLCECPNF